MLFSRIVWLWHGSELGKTTFFCWGRCSWYWGRCKWDIWIVFQLLTQLGSFIWVISHFENFAIIVFLFVCTGAISSSVPSNSAVTDDKSMFFYVKVAWHKLPVYSSLFTIAYDLYLVYQYSYFFVIFQRPFFIFNVIRTKHVCLPGVYNCFFKWNLQKDHLPDIHTVSFKMYISLNLRLCFPI